VRTVLSVDTAIHYKTIKEREKRKGKQVTDERNAQFERRGKENHFFRSFWVFSCSSFWFWRQ